MANSVSQVRADVFAQMAANLRAGTTYVAERLEELKKDQETMLRASEQRVAEQCRADAALTERRPQLPAKKAEDRRLCACSPIGHSFGDNG